MLPIYSILAADQTVKDLLTDGDRIRAWGFGYASEGEIGTGAQIKPYCVWRIPVDVPELGLTCDPLQTMTYQFDVYGRDGNQLEIINSALQYAVRLYGKVVSIRHPDMETDGTKLFVAGFDLDYIHLNKG